MQTQPSEIERRLIIIAPHGGDSAVAAQVMQSLGLPCITCFDIASLQRELYRGVGAVMAVEEALEDGLRMPLYEFIRAQAPWSDLPVLLLTRRGADSAVAGHATETLGNVTLIERPTRKSTLISAVSSALRARNKQYEVRQHLIEQKLASEAVRDSEQLYRGIGESIDFGIWTCDAEGKNIYTSDSFLKLTGLTQAQCCEFGWASALHPDDVETTIAAWKKCVGTKSLWDWEHRIKGADGQYHPVLARGVPILDESGSVIRWAGINLDISRLKRAEEALRKADLRKDEFLATLAHELRNPLAPIRNAVELMYRVDPQKLDLKMIRELIDRQSMQLMRLVDDLLDVARITRGQVQLQMVSTRLADVIQSAVETSRPAMDTASHHFFITEPDEHLMLNADPTRLAQCFSNLLHNATKFTPAGGVISLAISREGNEAVIRIKDSGVGISADALPNIFDMFTRASNELERSPGGLGIGLSLVKKFVEMHGGSVAASSGGMTQGSEFVVRLPISSAGPKVVNPAAHVTSVTTYLKGRRILVVDDNHDSADSISMLLRMSGSEVSTAYDGLEALEATERFSPEIILLDIGMPRLNGYEAAKRIRAMPHGDEVFLVAITGWGQPADLELSEAAGFNHHLVKPIDVTALESLLTKLH